MVGKALIPYALPTEDDVRMGYVTLFFVANAWIFAFVSSEIAMTTNPLSLYFL